MTRSSTDVAQVRLAAVELAAKLRGRGAEIEQAGTLPADVVAGLHECGIFRLWMPVELGGLEAEPADVLAIVQTLAEADGSTGWCAATGVASNVAGGLLSQAAAREIYPTGSELCGGALMPGGRAVPRAGGFEVDGRWAFGSGIRHCDWIVGGALVEDAAGGPPAARAVLMPRGSVELLDTWQVLGLSGTGSVDYQVHGLYVPERHTIELAALDPWPAGAMWRIPLRSLLYPILAAVPLGLARRAIAELTELAGERARFGSSRRLADRDVVQATVGRAQALTDAGAAYLSAGLQRLRQVADSGRVPGPAERAGARLAAVHATEQATRAVELCFRASGTAAIYQTSALQRALRDVNTAGQHYALSAPGYELTGRVLLGFEPDPLL